MTTEDKKMVEKEITEWIVRLILEKNDEGNGVDYETIESELQSKIETVISHQNGGPKFFFRFGSSTKLEEWLENNPDITKIRFRGRKSINFGLSDYMKEYIKSGRGELTARINDSVGCELCI